MRFKSCLRDLRSVIVTAMFDDNFVLFQVRIGPCQGSRGPPQYWRVVHPLFLRTTRTDVSTRTAFDVWTLGIYRLLLKLFSYCRKIRRKYPEGIRKSRENAWKRRETLYDSNFLTSHRRREIDRMGENGFLGNRSNICETYHNVVGVFNLTLCWSVH